MKTRRTFVVLSLTFLFAVTATEAARAADKSLYSTPSRQTLVQRVTVAVEQALKEKNVDKRLQRLSDISASLSRTESPAALEIADGLKELRERMVFKQTILSRWEDISPEGAFAWIARLPESQFKANTLREAAAKFARANPAAAATAAATMKAGRSRTDTIVLIANVWASTNVTAALAWTEKLPDCFAKGSALDAIRYVWVHSDPVAASAQVEKLSPGTTRNNLIGNVAFEWAALDTPAAIGWANRLPEGVDKQEALAQVAESWANRDPAAAAAFALKLPERETRAQAGMLVAAAWSKQDPRQAADWSARCGDTEVRKRATKEVIDLWAGVAPAECAAWIESLPAGPEREQTLRAFVTAAARWAPELAVRCAMLIENEAAHCEAVQECLRAWAEVDLPSATNWLNNAKLPEPVTLNFWDGISGK
jgi:hypothetical protein